MSLPFCSPRSHSAFTLVEILIVVAVVALLAALLFPVFGRTRESARQTSCLSNLHQIGLAVTQYSQDFNASPPTLTSLVPPQILSSNFMGGWGRSEKPPTIQNSFAPGSGGLSSGESPSDGTSTLSTEAASASGYLRSDRVLRCDDDSLSAVWARSSYGVLFWTGRLFRSEDSSDYVDIDGHFEPLMWNYFGYGADGTAFNSAQNAAQGALQPGANRFLRNPKAPYDARFNPFKASMSNRFLPPSTIITHCRFHRPATSHLSDPNALYTNPTQGLGARDAVLRFDGSARVVDVSRFNDTNGWQLPN